MLSELNWKLNKNTYLKLINKMYIQSYIQNKSIKKVQKQYFSKFILNTLMAIVYKVAIILNEVLKYFQCYLSNF